jgi:hypothetical protein
MQIANRLNFAAQSRLFENTNGPRFLQGKAPVESGRILWEMLFELHPSAEISPVETHSCSGLWGLMSAAR